jgi:hypothetical protein
VVVENLYQIQVEDLEDLEFQEKEIQVVLRILLEVVTQLFNLVVVEELGLLVERGLRHLVVLVATV